MRRLVFALALLLAGSHPPGDAQAADVDRQRALVNGQTVGIISGDVSGTYLRIAADLADAFDQGYDLRVLPMIGKGPVHNIEDLLLLRGIDVAIVQADVLEFYKRARLFPDIDQKIAYITKLYDEEIHLLAEAGIESVDALEGRRVNFGAPGSGTFMTAGLVFDDLGIDVEVATLPEPEALASLRAGDVDALVFVGGQPLWLVSQVRADEGLRLLPIPADRVRGTYVEASLEAGSYPQLIGPGEAVPTIAVGAVMAAYDWPRQHPRYAKLAHFVDRFFAEFDRLKGAAYHPKWQQVDLERPVPGWRRLSAAEAELAER